MTWKNEKEDTPPYLPATLPPTETTTASTSLCCPTGPLDMYKWSKRLASGTADSRNGCPSWLQLFLYITCKYGGSMFWETTSPPSSPIAKLQLRAARC